MNQGHDPVMPEAGTQQPSPPASLSDPGVGPLQRCVAVLRLLSTAGARGMALTAIGERTGLAPSTVHRLLAQMTRERLVHQFEDSRFYALGPLAFEIGLAAAPQFDQRSRYRPVLERLAGESGDTAYCILRSGTEAVTTDMVEGPSPIRVVTLKVGSRRPLGLGAGGLAILAALADDERRALLAVVQPQIERDWPQAGNRLRESVDEARRAGYAVIRNRVTTGVTAIGMPFSDAGGHVVGALSIATVNNRMTAARIRSLAVLLESAVQDAQQARRGPVRVEGRA